VRTVPAFASFDHAHSEPLEWLAETGLVGLLCVAAAWWWAPRPRDGAGGWVWQLGLVGLAAHALVDFPLRVPAVALVAAGCAAAWVVVGTRAPVASGRGSGAGLHLVAAALLAHHAVADALAARAERGDASASAGLARWAPWRPEGLIGELRAGWAADGAPVEAWAERAAAFPLDATVPRLVAAAALHQGDPERAASLVQQSLARDPNDWRTWRLRASVLQAQGDRGAAAEAFAEAMRHWPAEVSDGGALQQAWALRPVSVFWIDALADAPAHWSARLAVLLRQRDDPGGALLAAEQAARLRPEVHRWMPVTVDALLDLGLEDRAAAVVGAWLAEEPDDRWAWYAAARVNLHGGAARWPEAVEQAGLRGMEAASVRALVARCAAGAAGCDRAPAAALQRAWAARDQDPEGCEQALAEARAGLVGRPPVDGWGCGAR
jgi:tetratricopeptide (TPR) repeat protein